MTMGQTLRTALFGAAVAVAFTAVPALHAQSVSTDYDHTAQFENYHTFSFGQIKTDDPLYQQRLRDDIGKDLEAHGLQMVPSDGDLVITAIGGVHDKQEYNTFYTGLGPGFGYRGWGGWGGGWGGTGVTNTSVENVPVGTLMIDLYDTHTHNLVFRGTSHADVKKNSEKEANLVAKSVDKMFDHFPPKHAA